MDNRTIFIHIGLEKTGTTSIQDFLFNNTEKLKNKSIFYPTILGENQISLCIYSAQRKNVGNLAPEKQEIKIKENLPQTIQSIIKRFDKSNCENLVFSNEHLSSRLKNTNDIENLKRLFDHCNYPVKIVVYVRNQVDLLESLYFEGIKAGGKENLDDWANKFSYFELDYMKLLSEWESVFGKESIIVRLFDRRILKNGDAIDDFLDVLSVERNENFSISSQQNISLGYKSIEFMRRYNLNVKEPERMTYKLNNLLNDYNNNKQKTSLSYDTRVSIFDKYKKSNHQFLEKYLPEISYDFFVKTSRSPQEQEFSEDTLWDIINHLVKQNVKNNNKQHNKNNLLDDKWYRFGQMSNKRKVWSIARVISKKIKIYNFLKSLGKYGKS